MNFIREKLSFINESVIPINMDILCENILNKECDNFEQLDLILSKLIEYHEIISKPNELIAKPTYTNNTIASSTIDIHLGTVGLTESIKFQDAPVNKPTLKQICELVSKAKVVFPILIGRKVIYHEHDNNLNSIVVYDIAEMKYSKFENHTLVRQSKDEDQIFCYKFNIERKVQTPIKISISTLYSNNLILQNETFYLRDSISYLKKNFTIIIEEEQTPIMLDDKDYEVLSSDGEWVLFGPTDQSRLYLYSFDTHMEYPLSLPFTPRHGNIYHVHKAFMLAIAGDTLQILEIGRMTNEFFCTSFGLSSTVNPLAEQKVDRRRFDVANEQVQFVSSGELLCQNLWRKMEEKDEMLELINKNQHRKVVAYSGNQLLVLNKLMKSSIQEVCNKKQ